MRGAAGGSRGVEHRGGLRRALTTYRLVSSARLGGEPNVDRVRNRRKIIVRPLALPRLRHSFSPSAPHLSRPGPPMDPQLSGFALGLLFGAAKIGAIGTVAFGVAWWRVRRKLRRLERARADQIEARLASLEESAQLTAGQLDRLIDAQDAARRVLPAPPTAGMRTPDSA